MITFKTPKHHWNYFLTIEKDLENLSRYIEFSDKNLKTYSIELTHILLSASSEVDVIMKQLCSLISPNEKSNNINDYKKIINQQIEGFSNEEICISRYRLFYKPWKRWRQSESPDWWKSYNNVKHQRNNCFDQANLQNTINAVGALLVTVVYYYKYAFSKEDGNEINLKYTIIQLQPGASFMKINADDYYYNSLIF